MKNINRGIIVVLMGIFIAGPVFAMVAALTGDKVCAWLTFASTIISPLSLIYLLVWGGSKL
ncbi:MAG: hypothetical protein Q8O09_00220 [Bacillota bacterium]|nr:hypothetical protein [Bacillota bacterium]